MSVELMNTLKRFAEERDWNQFHTPANLAKSVSIEASELLECFQWSDDVDDLEAVKYELADVLTYAYFLANKLGLNPEEIVYEKLEITDRKYPVEKSYGNATKYHNL